MQIKCMLWMHVINLPAAALMTRLCPFHFVSWWNELRDRPKHPRCIYAAWHVRRDNNKVWVCLCIFGRKHEFITVKTQRSAQVQVINSGKVIWCREHLLWMGTGFACLEIVFKFHKSVLLVGTSPDENSLSSSAGTISHLLSSYNVLLCTPEYSVY